MSSIGLYQEDSQVSNARPGAPLAFPVGSRFGTMRGRLCCGEAHRLGNAVGSARARAISDGEKEGEGKDLEPTGRGVDLGVKPVPPAPWLLRRPPETVEHGNAEHRTGSCSTCSP